MLATVYPLGDIARRVAGERADVQWLIESGQTLESISPAELRDRAAQSRVVVTGGPADEWAPSSMSLDARAVRLVQPETMPAALQLYGSGPPDAKAHLWLDPKTVLDCVETLRQRMAGADPTHEPEYSKNAAAVRQSIEALDAELNKAIASLPNRKLLTVRPVWGAFCRRYGLEQVAPVHSPEGRLTEEDYRALVQAAKESGSGSVFVDVGTPAAVRHQIADRTKLNVLMLDTMGTSAPAGRSTYEKLMRYNVEQLNLGLGGQAAKKGAH